MSRTMKLKTQSRGLSGKAPFSTSGTTRTGRYTGKTSIMSSVHTPFKGTEPVGNGGCCGTYVTSVVNNCCKGTPSLGKSTMTTNGLFLSRVVNPTSVYNNTCDDKCQTTFYKNTSPLDNSSSSHTKNIVYKQMSNCYEPNKDAGFWKCSGNCDASNYHIGGKKIVFQPYTKKIHPVTSSEYMETKLIYNNCI